MLWALLEQRESEFCCHSPIVGIECCRVRVSSPCFCYGCRDQLRNIHIPWIPPTSSAAAAAAWHELNTLCRASSVAATCQSSCVYECANWGPWTPRNQCTGRADSGFSNSTDYTTKVIRFFHNFPSANFSFATATCDEECQWIFEIFWREICVFFVKRCWAVLRKI